MKKKIYSKPCIKATSVETESLLAGSLGPNEKKPLNDNENNQFAKKHGTSLWDETWDDEEDDEN